jgi:hypothetical protein
MNHSLRLPYPIHHRVCRRLSGWLGWKCNIAAGGWLTSAERFLVEIAATLMARYRSDELKSGDVSLLIGLLGKIGFSPKDRGALNLPARPDAV